MLINTYKNWEMGSYSVFYGIYFSSFIRNSLVIHSRSIERLFLLCAEFFSRLLTVNSICSFWQVNNNSAGYLFRLLLLRKHVPKIMHFFSLFILHMQWLSITYDRLTVNSICSFWQLNSIWGDGTTPTPKISETTGRMTMKFLPDVKLS